MRLGGWDALEESEEGERTQERRLDARPFIRGKGLSK